MNDLRYALRSLRHQPGFVAAVVITLGLGIGATTAIFSVVNGVLLRPLPYPESERLVRIWANRPDRNLPFFSVSPLDYRDWQDQAKGFETLAAFGRQGGVAMAGLGEPTEVLVSAVTPEVFEVLSVAPAVGRPVLPDDITEARPVVVASHAFWQQYLGAAPDAVGRAVTLGGTPHTLVGVMPPGFAVPGTPAELWTPMDLRDRTDRSSRMLRVLGRLAPGSSLEAAVGELGTISERLAEQYPASNRGWTVTVRTLGEMVVGDQFRRALLLLFAVVGLVLLIACANVANLLLVRASARDREFAVRAALGASRAQMFGQAAAESLLLGGMAGVVGLLLAVWGVEALRALRPAYLPRLDDIAIDGRVLGFTGIVSLGTGLVFGLVPVLRTRMAHLHATLRSDTRVSAGRGATRARAGLVVAQMALAMVLMVGATLLVWSLDRLQRVDLGFEPRDVLTFQINLSSDRYPGSEQALGFFDRLEQQVGELPGVTAVALVSTVPYGGPNVGGLFAPEGQQFEPGQWPDADFREASPNYFQTMGIPLLAGQSLPQGAEEARAAVVVNQTLARRFWPGESAVGRRVRMGGGPQVPVFTIVGVVADVRYQGLEAPETRPMFYFSHRVETPSSLTLVVRASGGASAVVAAVRRVVASLDPAQPVAQVRAMSEILGEVMGQRRFNTLLFGLFAGLAVTLAAIGIYAVLSYTVAQQAREIGVRVALGASRRHVVAGCVRQAAGLAGMGIVTGTALALGFSQVLGGLLYDTDPGEPLVFLGVVTGLLIVALAAAYVPARRAVRVDPMVALRHE